MLMLGPLGDEAHFFQIRLCHDSDPYKEGRAEAP